MLKAGFDTPLVEVLASACFSVLATTVVQPTYSCMLQTEPPQQPGLIITNAPTPFPGRHHAQQIPRGSGSARGGQGRDEVVEKARRERAEREKTRASRGHAIAIQRWYRGRSVAAHVRATERVDWDRKMSDFGMLQRTLVARFCANGCWVAVCLWAVNRCGYREYVDTRRRDVEDRRRGRGYK